MQLKRLKKGQVFTISGALEKGEWRKITTKEPIIVSSLRAPGWRHRVNPDLEVTVKGINPDSQMEPVK